MGRKRNRTWKYLYLSIACVIFVALAGCATPKEMEAKRETGEYLTKAQRFLEQGDFEGAFIENQKVLSLSGHVPPGDEALLNIGLIYAHYGYPKRDYAKSIDYFKRLIKGFPQSPLAGLAKVWVALLQENQRLDRENEKLNRENERLNKGNEKLNRDIEESNKSMKKSQQENERLNKQIEELSEAMKKAKQVDIEIDEKKKEFSK